MRPRWFRPPPADGEVRTHVLIGRLDDGSPWAVPMVSTSDRFAWRPLTAYPIDRNQTPKVPAMTDDPRLDPRFVDIDTLDPERAVRVPARPANQRRRLVSVRLPAGLIDQLQRAAAEDGRTVSDVIRDLITAGLARRTAGDRDLDSIASLARALADILERKAEQEALPTP